MMNKQRTMRPIMTIAVLTLTAYKPIIPTWALSIENIETNATNQRFHYPGSPVRRQLIP